MSFEEEISACIKLEVDWGSHDLTVLREKQVHGDIVLLLNVTKSWSIVVSLFLKEMVPGYLEKNSYVTYLREKHKQDTCKRSRY